MSSVPTYRAPRIETRLQRRARMLREGAARQAATGAARDEAGAGPGAMVSLRACAVAAFVAVLALALGGALFEGVAGERTVPASQVRRLRFSREGLLSLPLAAQGLVSAAMGADSPAYRVSVSNGGFAAASPQQGLTLSFHGSGVSISSGATRVGLSLQAVGYGTSLRALGSVAPRVRANRVVYARAGLSEWYVNGPLGLEQGFTIPRAPSGHPAGPLTLSMALSGDAHASLGSGGKSITLSRTDGPSLRYSGLSATDAHGRVLHSWLEPHAGGMLLRVDTRGALYPLRIDPFVQQAKLTGSGESGEGLFGISVALSSDGNTALIGGYGDNLDVGAAWVFTRSGSTWTQQGEKLTGEGLFGISVALSSDGNTALIGSAGAAWVFTRSGSTWTQQGEKLTGSGEVGRASVALSSDGNTALIGGPDENEGVGAAWVFTRSGSTWTQQGGKLTGSEESCPWPSLCYFGASVALSSDGNTALIGGPLDNSGWGAAWVFTRSGSTWTQQGARLTGSGEIGKGFFGESVALSSDGDTALIGGPYDNEGGAAWVYTRSGSTWTQEGAKRTGSGEVGYSDFGASVVLSSDDATALIGGYGANSRLGAAWVFVNVPQEGEYGQCKVLTKSTMPKAKKGKYVEEDCQTLFTKKGKPEARGNFEWVPGPSPACEPQKKAEYTNNTCTAKSLKAHKGSFERESGPGYTSTTGTVTLETPGLGSTVVCAASTAAGEVTGVISGVERITFTGCETSGKACTSEGPNSTPSGKAGVIITNLLDTRLAGSVLGAIWTEFVSSEHEPYLLEFGCEGPLFRTVGLLGGVQAGNINVSSFTSTTTFATGEGEQRLETELSETGGLSWVGPDASSEVTVANNTAASKTEIKPRL